jgi:WD40 repeat protein
MCSRVTSLVPVLLVLLIPLTTRAADPVEKKARFPVLLQTIKGHTSGIYYVVFAPDGKHIATCGRDKIVRLWEHGSGKQVHTYEGNTESVYSVAFSPDGATLAAAGEDRKVRLYQTASGKLLHTCEGHTADVYHVGFNPTGDLLVSTGSDHTVRLWDPKTGKEIKHFEGHTDRVLGLAFTPDGGRLVTSCGTRNAGADNGGEVKVWDLAGGREVFSLTEKGQGVLTVAISADGKRLAGACLDGKVRLWELATGKLVLELTGHSTEIADRDKTVDVYSVAFSPDGRFLASCSGDWNSDRTGTVRLWDLATGKEAANLAGFNAPIWRVAFSPDGKRLAASSGHFRKAQAGEVRVWDVSGLPRDVLPEPTAKEVDALFDAICGTDAGKAYRAVWTLGLAPKQAIPFLDKHMKTEKNSPLERIPQLIKDLDDEDFTVREKATAELEKMGRIAFPALQKAATSPSLEVRRRVEELLSRKVEGPTITPEELKLLRLIEACQHIGTAEVRPLLERLARGPSASQVTQDAKRALTRLK